MVVMEEGGGREARSAVARSGALGGRLPWRAGAEAEGKALPNTEIGRWGATRAGA